MKSGAAITASWRDVCTSRFDVAVMVDWSGASSRGPARPSPDRCWLAWGRSADGSGARPEAEYFRTRLECARRVEELAAGMRGSVLIGFDFPIGYPGSEAGSAVLPAGRELCGLLENVIRDGEGGANNRFEAAAGLNRRIRAATGRDEGPFWGCPVGRVVEGLTPKKTRRTGVREFREVESRVRAAGRNIQSAWKLMGAGSVGSQSLLGLPVVARLLRRLGDRATLWPFEPFRGRDGEVVVAEIWPSLGDQARYTHPIKDARQVLAMRDQALDGATPMAVPAVAAAEGWILGVPLTAAEGGAG